MSGSAPIPVGRLGEHDALVRLLLDHASGPGAHEVAERIAVACMGSQHLWRDMGLGSRAELRGLFETHFPSLAEGNDRDMRWKRYLYKRLCGWQGFSG